jgi:hypothetical protein
MNRISDAEVTPGMSTRTAQMHAITAGTKRPICNAIYSWPIKAQESINPIGPFAPGQEMSHATQIALAFFADRANKKERTFGFNLHFLERESERD